MEHRYRKEGAERGGDMRVVRRRVGWFVVGGIEDGRKKSNTEVSVRRYATGDGGLTGSTVDSNWPQSITRPVIRPTERRASKGVEANDIDGILHHRLTWNACEEPCKNTPGGC